MSARRTVVVLVAAVALTLLLVGQRALVLLTSGSAAAVVMGVAVLAVAAVGGWLVLREVRFGRDTERLAHDLDAEGGLPVDDLPRRPSGRVVRGAADAAFARRRAAVESDPADWRGWFRLAVAYDDAGDRRRARAAMRRAIALHHGAAAGDGPGPGPGQPG